MKWKGERPLLMHNGLLADRKYEHTIAIKRITSKKSSCTEADRDEVERLEWMGGLYWSDEIDGLYIPGDNIHAAIVQGARRVKLGKQFAAGLIIEAAQVELNHRMRGKTREEMYADPGYINRSGIVVQKQRVMRVRPQIPTGWSLTFTAEFAPDVIDRDEIINACVQTGALIGLGDWRPKFGRFTVEVVK